MVAREGSAPSVEPEVVATSPCPIKSRVPVYYGFSSVKWWAREDLHLQGSQILDLWGLLILSLASRRRRDSLVRLAFQKSGPRGRTCSCNLPDLSGAPLHWATRGSCSRSGLH